MAGEVHHLVWLRKELENTYELKVQVAGWEAGDSRELSFLGRIIRLSASGIELEGGDKHVVGIIDEWDMKECSPVSTPYVKPPAHETSAEGRPPMSPKDATLFRRAAARINYVAMDRPDLSFSSRVASGKMSNPLLGDDMLIQKGHQVP